MTIPPLPPPSNGTEGSGAVEAAALDGRGTQAAPYVVTTADDLTAALAMAKADDDTYIALKGVQNADSSTYTLNLGDKTYSIIGKRVVFKDAGVNTAIVRTTEDWKTPLFTIGNEKGDAQNNGEPTTKSSLTFTSDYAAGSTADEPAYLLSYSKQNAPLFRVIKGASLTVNGGNFENNAAWFGPVIQNGFMNKYNEDQDTPELDWGWGGQLVVNGGLFKGNHSGQGDSAPDGTARPGALYGGGAIFISTPNSGNSTVNGGVFDGNYVPQVTLANYNRGGGAIHSRRGGLTITGGVFKNNHVDGMSRDTAFLGGGGGAVYVAAVNNNEMGLPDATVASKLVVTNSNANPKGPTFTENKSTGQGGAIFVSWNANASFEYGTFTNNSCDQMGGAIYTEEVTVSSFGYAAVYENTAAHFGGGLWLCPSGVSISSQRSNLALFNNTAGGEDALKLDSHRSVHGDGAAGDDFAIMYPNKNGAKTNSFYLSNGWYTGLDAAKWYEDGKSTVKATGFGYMNTGWGIGVLMVKDAFTVLQKVPRYEAGQTAAKTGLYTLTQSKADIDDPTAGGYAFKVIPKDGEAEKAEQQAHLTFTGNTAGMSGGAIGSNGRLRFTSSGVAAWSKVDANDTSKALGGSSWKLTWTAPDAAATPYADATEENDLWNGAADTSAKWSKDSGTWVAMVEDNTGEANYVGYDTDSRPGYFAIENLAEGEFSFTEQTAPAGYEKSDATYQFKVDLSTADSAAAYPDISVKDGNAVKNNAIGNTPLPVNVFFMLTKKLIGKDLTNRAFSFSAYEKQADGTYSKDAVATARNGEGAIASSPSDVVFSSIKMTKEGESVYKIVEDPAEDPAILNDPTVFYAKVTTTMSKNPNGESAGLTASISYYKDEGLTKPAADVPEFTNYATTLFEFTKVDGSSGENNGKPLYGVKFKLYKRTGEALTEDDTTLVDAAKSNEDLAKDGWAQQGNEVTTDASNNGLVIFDKLPVGTYQLVETAAPAGYQLPTGQWRIVVKEVPDDSGKKTLKVEGPISIKGANGTLPPAFISPDPGAKGGTLKLPNYKGFTLPVSGSTGIWWSGVAGMAMIAASLAALWWQRRRGGGVA